MLIAKITFLICCSSDIILILTDVCGLTVCVTCVWAGVDSAWEQEKLEARKMLLNRADSHTSGARGVGRVLQDGFELNAFMSN